MEITSFNWWWRWFDKTKTQMKSNSTTRDETTTRTWVVCNASKCAIIIIVYGICKTAGGCKTTKLDNRDQRSIRQRQLKKKKITTTTTIIITKQKWPNNVDRLIPKWAIYLNVSSLFYSFLNWSNPIYLCFYIYLAPDGRFTKLQRLKWNSN